MLLFYALFHHLFIQTMHDVAEHVVASGEYSLEFVKQGVFLLVFIRFWRKDELCRILLKRTGRVLGQSSAELYLIADVMAALSTSPNHVSCSGCTLETIQLVDSSPYFEQGLQRPLRFEDFSIARLMHKESYSVFGRIDFHSVLKYLIVFLGGCLDCNWTLMTPVLAKVRSYLFTSWCKSFAWHNKFNGFRLFKPAR